MAFAYASYPGPSARQVALVLLAMVTARTAAMSFNRWVDADLDADNPRTRGRPIPSGRLHRGEVLLWTAASSAAFLVVCALLNARALALSPVALAWILGYSYTKRLTFLSHLWLGIAAGAAPSAPVPWLISAAVAFWVAGFDVIYATQDGDFDRRVGLFSAVTRFGLGGALNLARAAHALSITLLVCVALRGQLLGGLYLGGVSVAAALILWEHALVRVNDLSRVNTAFFTANGLVSLALCAATIVDIYWW
jgi:4-hydroxybenzoate polyprenyltransferase